MTWATGSASPSARTTTSLITSRCRSFALLLAQAQTELRHQNLLFNLKIGDTRQAPHGRFDFFGHRAQDSQLGAEDLDRDLRANAGEQVINAV